MTLNERAQDFLSRFPEKRLCVQKLRKIYNDHKIRRKKIKITKLLNSKQRKKIKKQTDLAAV